MPNAIPKRNELDAGSCWSVEDLFPSDEAWNEEFERCKSIPGELRAYQGRLGESAQTLYSYMELLEKIEPQLNLMANYAFLRHDEDTTNPVYQAMNGRCQSFLVQLDSARSFERPELVSIPEEALEGFYKELPDLEKYRRYLTRARQGREHVLSQNEENLLAAAGEIAYAPGRIFNTYCDADMKFPTVMDSEGKEHPLSNGSFISLMESPDRTLRKNTFTTLYKVYGDSRNGLAAMLDSQVRTDIFYARARKYDNALQAALHPVEVPEAVYHNLLEAVHQNLDKLHKYMGLRKRAMGLDELHMYDIYASMIPEAQKTVPFEQARRDVLDAMAVLGEEYTAVLEKSFEQRWMDIYENEGKRSGAYSCGTQVHPFVLLNYKDTLDSEFTLAHEMGHAMHSYLSYKYQRPINSEYVLFVAEVASTCNEALLMQYLLKKTTDKKERASLINHFLEQFRSTLYRQAMFADFELQIHQLAESGESLTAETLCKMYYDINKQYYGEEMVVDEDIALEWSRIPHFYLHYYVYQYATGFSAAMALSKRILDEGEPAVKDYLSFLSGGCSKDPISLLKMAGVDVSTPQPVNDALRQFGELMDEFEQMLK